MRYSLRTKTVLGVALIELLLLVLLITTAIKFMRDSANEAMQKRAATAATLFATTTKDAVLSYDLASLDAFVSEVLRNPDVLYARVLDSQGTVFAEGGHSQILARPFQVDSDVDAVDDDVYDAEALITESGETFGRVQLGIGTSSINQAMSKITRWTITIAAIEMALVALFSFILGIYLTQNLKLLREGASRIASSVSHGEYAQVEVSVPGQDELSDVANAFNKLSVALEIEHDRREEFEQELKVLNQTLEQKVESRTNLLKKRNQQLEKINHELQSTQQQLLQSEKMASVGQLAAGVAHEINNPVGFVASNLGSLQEYNTTYRDIAQTVRDFLHCKDKRKRNELAQSLFKLVKEADIEFLNEDSADLIQESINGLSRVTDIIKSLKQFAHVDEDEKQLFDLNECIQTTINMVNNELKYHCTLHTDLSPLPQLPLHGGKIIQVITNLLVNAGHAIEGNGDIYVHTHCDQELITLTIRDTGKGIKPDDLHEIFNPFFTTKPIGQGTGLGLSICYDIIQEHQGNITVESEVGKGTCFTITLPITPEEDGENPPKDKELSASTE